MINFSGDIKKYANIIENRLCDDCYIDNILQDNAKILNRCQKYDVVFRLIVDDYNQAINKILM